MWRQCCALCVKDTPTCPTVNILINQYKQCIIDFFEIGPEDGMERALSLARRFSPSGEPSTSERNMKILVASGMASLTIVGAMLLAYSI